MKTIFFAMMMSISLLGNAQVSKTSPDNTNFPFCPPGMCLTGSFTIEKFDLHKPRTNCTSGFGMCLKIGFTISCESCNGKAYIQDDKVYAWATLNKNELEIHIPTSIKNEKEFENTDMTQFEIDDNTLSFTSENGNQKSIIGGLYPVSVINDDYVINLKSY